MIQLFATTNEISFAAADVFVQCADRAIRQHQKFVVALTGGVLQLQLYKLLSAYPYRDQVEWDRVYIFWSNEQLSDADGWETNFEMAFKMLLSHVPISKDHLFPMYIAGEQPNELVERYEYLLNQHLGKGLSFDLILLGMCKDGHVASLLPGTDVLKESLRYVYAFKWQNISHITLTASIINKAKKVVVMVYGLNKATVLREVVEGVRNVQKYPAQLLTPENGEILWLTDKAAASKLLISIGK